MRKILLLCLFMIFVLPSVLAINLNVEPQGSKEVIIHGIDQPAEFDVNIKNLGESNDFQFYNLLGFSMAPKGTVHIDRWESKTIKILIYPKEGFNYDGFYTFKYFIRGSGGDEISQEVTIKAIDLKDAFEIGSGDVNVGESSMQIYIYNRENFDFENIDARFKSPFFDFEKNFSLEGNERKNFDVVLNKEDFKKVMAGFYTLNSEIKTYGKEVDIEGVIKFVEKDILTSTKEDYGLIINTQIISKKNEGNLVAETETVIKKNILSRLFTSFSPEPDSIDRSGISIYYTWARKIPPGEALEITVKTNWLLPLFVILFIIASVALARQYTRKSLTISKRISFVRAKGGEFALRVSVFAFARSHVEKVSIIDRLPSLVKVHEKFGSEKPKRVSEKNRSIEWEFSWLEAGETRVMSYIIYSKIGVVGKFSLPTAIAVYEKDGKIHEAESNRAYFVAEQRGREED